MSLDIYAAKLEDGVYGPVLGFEHSDFGNYDNNGNFTLNPNYIPGVSLTMSGGNFYALIQALGYGVEEFKDISLEDVRRAVIQALEHRNDSYTIQRLIQLHNVCELGLARGAVKLIWG